MVLDKTMVLFRYLQEKVSDRTIIYKLPLKRNTSQLLSPWHPVQSSFISRIFFNVDSVTIFVFVFLNHCVVYLACICSFFTFVVGRF